MMKKITVTFLFLAALSIYGQSEKMNAYKYIIVSDKFDFLKSADQYQTSSLTKFLLQKNGFEVFLSNEAFPEELRINRCLALLANVTDNSGMFSVKSTIVLKDCSGAVVYTSEEGKSKEKEYKKGYHEAIRNAHESMVDFLYSYQPEEALKKEIAMDAVPEVSVPAIKKEAVIKIKNDFKNTVFTKKEMTASASPTILYAQAIENGFQLVNTIPEVVFQILKTKNNDLYIMKDKNGILYKDGDSFIGQFYEGNKLIVKQYTIKF